jgi:hypothetical protein
LDPHGVSYKIPNSGKDMTTLCHTKDKSNEPTHAKIIESNSPEIHITMQTTTDIIFNQHLHH